MVLEQDFHQYLGRLNLDPAAADLYLALSKHGVSSALQLARATHISRTQVYRHLEDLQAINLVSSEDLGHTTLYRALPITNIEGALADREAEIAGLRNDLGAITKFVQHLSGATGPTATVHHYYGMAGLKQVNWNLTKAEKEYRVFEVAHLSQHLEKSFARKCRERYIARHLTSYDLTNATKIFGADIEPYDPAKTFYRHIDPAVLDIQFEVYVYNDVVTLLDHNKDQLHALEIHHPVLNQMMTQLFNSMWQQAVPLKVIE